MPDQYDAICTSAELQGGVHTLRFEIPDAGDRPATFTAGIPDNEYHQLRKGSDSAHYRATEEVGWIPLVYGDNGWEIHWDGLEDYSYR